MITTFTKVFLPVFFSLFLVAILGAVVLPKVIRSIRKHNRLRNRNRTWYNDTELTTVAGNADINRISAADFPSTHISIRNYHRRPEAARLVRHTQRFSAEYQNPFADPPRHYPSAESFNSPPRNRSIPNFSTPTRRGRTRSSTQDTSNTMRATPTVTFCDHSDPFNDPDHAVRPSQSLTFERPVSVVSFPEPSYQPATLSVHDLSKCEPRSAGQAPPLGRKLNNFPLPKSGSAHLHPNAFIPQVAGEIPPTPPATVTKIGYFTGTTGAKNSVSHIREHFGPSKSLHAAKPSIAASSFYSCDEQGNHVADKEEVEEEEEEVVGRPMPKGKAPGGAEWI